MTMSFFARIRRLRPSMFGVPATALLGLAGCSSSPGGPAGQLPQEGGAGDAKLAVDGGGVDGSVPGSIDGALPTETGPMAEGGGTDGGATDGSAAGNGKGGQVLMLSASLSPTTFHEIAAAFLDATGVDAGGPGPCTTTVQGACLVTQCSSNNFPVQGTFESAGKITITGGAIPSGGIVLTPGANGAYAVDSAATKLWSGGETMQVSSVGAIVPAFTQTVAAPNQATVTAPAISQAQPTLVNRAQPFVVTWTGGGAGDVVVVLNDTNASGAGTSLLCSFAASASSGTVPAAALSGLQPGSGKISVQAWDRVTFAQGDWSLSLVAVSPCVNMSGMQASGTTTIQ